MAKKIIPVFIAICLTAFLNSQNPFLSKSKSAISTAQTNDAHKQSEQPTHTANKVTRTVSPLLQKIISIQKQLNEKTSSLIVELKENKNRSVFLTIIAIVFLYGVFHALGPGHGKSIMGGYIIGSNHPFRNIVTATALAGFFHAFTSVVLITASYVFLKKATSLTSSQLTTLFQNISGFLLMGLAIHTIFSIIKRYSPSKNTITEPKPLHPVLVAASIGVVPCPISGLILLFSLSNGLIIEGYIFVLFFTLGMILTVFLIASILFLFQNKVSNIKSFSSSPVFSIILPIISSIIFITIAISLIEL